ncbi:hypothetical protein GGR21_002148 [Dysgonomonas hofstadii]|uniref:Putative auto-transporter adhesin head GIN domain-containing protein n=1 Tax=Dysgonomonas hofstadii TaxID=637886 RepID=A0A840CJM6_9BACT|nr:head GIN domain-containing protein [Dysgonomonas hofstadii]MBB4036247.1 hypothetical protein [Dysgonomonas hofstadii]
MKVTIYTLAIILLSISFQACNFRSIRGDGNIVSNEISISDYDAIEFSGGATLVYEQKNDTTPYLRIEIDENLYPLLEVKSENGTLTIKQQNKTSISPTKYEIYTNSKELGRISASGSIKAQIKGKLVTDEFKFKVSGSGNITCDSLVARSVTSRVSGSGDINLTGKAGTVDCAISGSGKVKAAEMVADTVYCSVSGSGNFFVHAEKYLKVSVSGSGNVQYKGDPEIDKSISGSGKVIKMN